MDAMEQLRKNRIQNFKNVISGQGKIDHIPHFGNYWSWKYYDAGYKLTEALFDYDKTYDTMEQFFRRYPMDACYETGWRNPVQVLGPLGKSNAYSFDDKNYSISVKDQEYISRDDYDALIANPKKFLWETFLPKKFSVLENQENSVDFRDFVQRYLAFGGVLGKIGALGHSLGMADFADPNGAADYWGNGYEMLFCAIRGMKNLALDLRRCPDKVQAACEALDEVFALPRLERGYAQPDGSNPEYCVDMNPVMLGHVILSPKQFERFYWPHLQRIAKVAQEKDKLVFLFVEGSGKLLWDYFRELPENRFAILCELDDPFEMKKALPNMVVCGGSSAELLGQGTPEQNVAYARRLIEEIGGEDHRFIYSPGKMISFPGDCSRENLSAICQYLNGLKY